MKLSISSVNAFRSESPEAHYNATKAGIVAVMRSFANELGHLGLRFNCVAPGEDWRSRRRSPPTTPTRTGAWTCTRPAGRAFRCDATLRPTEQARVVLFLASDDASYINGETIVADGGELSGDWYDTEARPPVPERLAGLEPAEPPPG